MELRRGVFSVIMKTLNPGEAAVMLVVPCFSTINEVRQAEGPKGNEFGRC